MRRNTGFVTSELAEPPTLNATSDGVYELTDQYYHATNEEWPVPPALRTMSSNSNSFLGSLYVTATTHRTTSDAPIAPGGVVPTLTFYQNLFQTHTLTIQGIDSDLYIKVVLGTDFQALFDLQGSWSNIVNYSTNMPSNTSASMETTLPKEAIPMADSNGVSLTVYNLMWQIKFIHIGTSDLPFDIEIYNSAARTADDLLFTIPCLLKAIDVQPVTISGGTGQNNANSEPIFNEGQTATFSFTINNLGKLLGNSSTDVNIYSWLNATTDTVDDFDATVDGASMTATLPTGAQYPRISYSVDIPIKSDLLTENTEKFEWITRISYLDYFQLTNQWAISVTNSIFDGVTPAGNTDGVFAIEISDTSTTLPGVGSGLTATSPTSITEGSTYTLTITDTTNSSNTGDFYYSVIGNGGLSSADLSINTSTFYGPVQMTNGTVSISFDVNTDTTSPETGESFTVYVSHSDSNAIPFFNTTCTVTDVPSPTIDQHLIPANLDVLYTNTSSDNTGNYDVYSFPVSSGLAVNSSKRIYIGVKVRTSTTFYNDVCIAAVQHLNSSGTVINTWAWTSGNSDLGWQTTTAYSGNGYSNEYPSSGSYPQLALVEIMSYSNSLNTTATGVDGFTLASATGSSQTGMAGGVTQTASTVPYTVGSLTEPQTNSNYYAYRETSGSTRYSFAFLRTASAQTFNPGDEIRVVAKFVTRSTMQGSFNHDDILYVGIY
jgi:hypothetical protein|tara:strand:- start:135 stop:2285 length:2151 start_codon:yes stop_codon:yes gene_type:complete